MSRNYKLAALVLASIAGVLLISSWGRTVLLGVVGMALLPVWGLLLASVFLIVCIIIGAVIVAVSDATEEQTQPAVNVINEPIAMTEPVVIVDEEERPRAA